MSPVIILTGASRGLGLSILQLLLKADARVVTLSRSKPDALVQLQEQYKDQLEVVRGDAASVEDNAGVVKAAVDRWGGIDGVVVNAGTIEPTRIADIPLDKTGQYVSTNLLSVLYLVQPALPYLRKAKGRVVLVSSGASGAGYTSWGLYSMVKAGMNSLARTLANEEKELSVWAIRPGMVDMQELLRSLDDGVMDAEELVKFTSAYENGKLLKPEQPGAIIAGLALDGPKDLSGEYLNWEDERLASYKVKA